MPVQLPRLDRSIPLVNDKKTPSLPFHQWWQKVVETLTTSFNTLETAVIDIQAALDAAATAQTAADTAQTAANTAQTAATAAQNAADDATGLASVSTSGTNDVSITATDAGSDVTIDIAAHNRLYANGTTVAVNSGSLTGRAYSTLYYIYYDDAARTGGAVTYQSTTTKETAAQTGDRHLVGSVTTPAALGAPNNGTPKPPPGFEGIV